MIKAIKTGEEREIKGVSRFTENGNPFVLPPVIYTDYIKKNTEVTKENIEALRDYLKFLKVFEKTQIERPEPAWATKNSIRIDLHTLKLRDFSRGGNGIYTLIIPPYAGHASAIVDFNTKQSLVETLIGNGIKNVCSIDWKSATEEIKYYNINNYLSELDICVDELGGRVNLAGMCQGGWLGAMYAARFPDKVNTLILGGAPIDTDAGDGTIIEYAHRFPMEFFEGLVAIGGGVLKGDFMLDGFKSLHPNEQYIGKYVALYERINNPAYVKRFEIFERWYEYTIDLPGKWYLQVVKELFKENRFFKGEFIGLGKKLSLGDIKCPVYLLGGERDDITPKEQVFNAEKHLGTDKSEIVKDTANGGHIGLFMGLKPLGENWPKIVKWIKAHSTG
ncbi:poly(3-hydroxyalkanoate) synthetase [Candidatus Methanoperedens nitroreducens]|uniref:Poly(3-hydroxyalkanoate) synthetase n=1 Tax=Candidatus Methanoperedens nitratireducens TaxID=1392998 RepID=A0A062V6X6_9EURY|nr:alpha/beta fold hydrolase [Candidatus Methanoperedens nitroreducens]KCZ73057.1 poly(3-hydroxyalkanoate) synthetase [Candidatus Methanoperedens nitroreducens]MDJ1422997.1 alpha/beta fold hydrolase [Candidatus Methanoperedens sp.]